MNKRVKLCLALFLALTVLVQYSFSPQAMVAYGLDNNNEVTAASTEDKPEPTQAATTSAPEPTQATTAPKPASEPSTSSDSSGSSDSSASSDSSESTEPTESTESADDSNAASEDANTDTDTEDPTTVEEEAAVDEEEAEEEEEEGWENSFSGSCNGLTVHVSAPDGAFKEGTKMVLGAVSDAAATNIVSSVVSEETEVVDVVGVDISFKYKGKTIQPDESVKVSISGAHLEGDNPVLYHKHGGTIEQLGASNNGASFTTSTFSPFVFAVTAQAVGETWKVTFYDRDAQQYAVVDVPKGEAIGDQLPDPIAREDYNPYWVIGKIVQGEQGPEFKKTGSRIDKTFVPEGDTTVGPDYDLTTYTVTFYKEDKTTVVAERTVTADSNYCVNDIPAVPAKSGSVGKWVYSGGDFGNKVKITQNTDVWAAYSQNVFTVTFKVEDSVYQTDTYFSGDTLKLPSAPVVDGKEFKGWLAGETQYVGGEEVTSNLTLVADFDSLYTVSFIVEDDDGKPIESLSQYFTKTEDEAIGTMPQDPFIQGKVFDKWVDQDGYTVTKDTVVKGDIIAKAQFHAIDVYTVTASFYYYADNGEKIIFDTQVKDIDKIPYTLNPPASTQTQQEHVDGAPVYYPSETSITLTADKFDSDKKASVEVQYVKYTAKYDVNHMLKDLEGDGYSVIDTDTDLEGVWGSLANLPVNEYEYYNWEKSQEKPIIEHTGLDGEEKDVFNVYYTRKNVSLSYETNGGSYVAGETVPYGTTVALPSENPKRTGYTFAGWYADAALTKAVTGSVTVEGDTTLYAKWTGATVNYTIIYMKEKYNAGGNEWVYENSRTATATAGTTVYAANAPKMQRTPNGYELSSEMNGTATAGGQGADTAVEIAADGSSVVKVYYSLIRYTIVFNINRNNGEINMGGATYSGSNYRIQNVVIGQDVSSQWPAQSSEIYSTNRYFDGWTDGYHSWLQITKVSVIDYEYFEAANSSHVVTWTAQWSRTTADRSAEYWLQQADGSYVRDNSLNQFGLNTTSLGGRQISGYTLHNGAPRGYTGSGYGTDAQGHYRYIYRFYYDRARYQIDYYYGDTKLTTKSNIYYEANINTTEYDYTPARPSGVDSDYTWGGWYADAKFAQKYEFKKMPGNNLALYAKWNAPTYNVKFVDDDGTTELAESQTVEKYKMATKPENNPTKKGYKFEGWFASKDGDEYYDWSNQITNNTVIYAHWTAEPLSYTVHYVDAANEQTKLADDKTVTNLNFKEGDTITEQALTIAGYRPDQGTKDVTLVRGKTNEITFKYTLKGESVPYTVKYILDPEEHSGNIPVAEEKTGTTDKDELIELAAAVDYDALYAAQPTLKGEKFFPDSVEKTLVLGTGENVLTFYYSQYKSVKVTVTMLIWMVK